MLARPFKTVLQRSTPPSSLTSTATRRGALVSSHLTLSRLSNSNLNNRTFASSASVSMAAKSDAQVVLYTQTTPNGIVPAIFIEELKAEYGQPDYDVVPMSIRDADIGKVHNQVKSPWYLELNPNGKIPTITHDGFPVFETSAILLYLAQQYDKENIFSRDAVKDPKGYSEILQWLFFVHGGVGPMQGQAGHFSFAPEKIPYAINRYQNETKRLYGVLESRLSKHDYLVGNEYSIADIKAFGWARALERVGLSFSEFPKVKAWVDRIEARPAVKAGLAAISN